jgi:hypothetical protein
LINVSLKSTLSEISIATPACIGGHSANEILDITFKLKTPSCRSLLSARITDVYCHAQVTKSA